MLVPLGSGPITDNIISVFDLFDKDGCPNKVPDVLVMVDGESGDFVDFMRKVAARAFSDDARLIYMQHRDADVDLLHPLCFLMEFFDTYTISLETVSCNKLLQIIEHLCGYGNGNDSLLECRQRSISDLKQPEVMRKLYDSYPCLSGFAEAAVRRYMHAIKNAVPKGATKSGISLFLGTVKKLLDELDSTLAKAGLDGTRYKCVNDIKIHLAAIEALKKKSIDAAIKTGMFLEPLLSIKKIAKEEDMRLDQIIDAMSVREAQQA